MKEITATLSINQNHYSVFRVGDLTIKFYTSPYLLRYCEITQWKNKGYIEYKGEVSTSKEPIEDSIDLAFIAERLHLPKDVYESIEEVKIV